MAASYIAKGTYASGNSGTITAGLPSGHAAGDILLLTIEDYTSVPALPSGWTNIATASGTVAFTRTCYKIATASESAVVITVGANSTRAIMVAFRGIDHASTIISSLASVITAATTALSFGSFGATGDTDDMFVLAIGFRDADATDTSNASGYSAANVSTLTERHDQCDTSGTGGGIILVTGLITGATTVGPLSATADISGGNYAAIGIKLRKAGIPACASRNVPAAGTSLQAVFSKAMANPAGKHAQFTVMVNGVSNPPTAAALDADTTKINLTLTSKVYEGDTVTVAYTAGTILSFDGGALASFTAQAVTNNSTNKKSSGNFLLMF